MKRTLISIYRWTLGFIVFTLGGSILVLSTLVPWVPFRFRVARGFCKVFLRSLGARLRVEGTFPNDQAYIFMANHASFADMFILAAITKDKFTGVMAAENMNYPLWAWIVKRLAVIPIERGNLDAAKSAIREAENRLQRGFHVGIMPEGTRTLTGKLGPMKKGGFHMALNTGAPIVLIGIEGAFRFKPKTSWQLSPGTITVRIGPILPAERTKRTEIGVVMELVRRQLLILSGETVPAGPPDGE